MKTETREWVQSAEENFTVADFVFRRRTKVGANSIAFHCQQSVKKYLKACLEESGLPVPRTRNMVALVTPLLLQRPLWAAFKPALRLLNNYEIECLYPGHTATRADGLMR